MRLLPQNRGIRVRPYMRKMNAILAISIILILLLPVAFYGYINFEALKAVDIKTVIILAVLMLLAILFGVWFSWLFREQTPFGKKLDRLGIMSRYLFDHGIMYEKKKKGQNTKTSYRFPKIFMKQRRFDLNVSFEMAGNKFQDKFSKMGSELEKTLFMDYMETQDDVKYKTYTMAYSAFLNRINIPDVTFEKGKGLKLMNNFYWDYDSDPHLLVAGGTGGGKTVLLRTLILALAKVGVVDVCDPKQADFVTMADMKAFKGRVAFSVDEIVEQFEKAFVIMMARYKFMNDERKRLNHKDLKKYYEYGLEPYFLVCDEYNALMSMLDYKQRDRVDSAIGNLLLLGRQAGCFAIIAMQKPSREDLGSKLQANINMRLSVGRLDEAGYDIMFGEINRNKEFKYLKYVSGTRVYGRGYGAVSGEVAREFYSPNLPKGFVFYDYFEQLERHSNQFDPNENSEITADIVRDEEVLAVAEEATKSAYNEALFGDDKEKVSVVLDLHDVFSLNDIVKKTDKSFTTVRKMVLDLESKGYCSFERNEKNHMLFTSEEVDMIVDLFKQKENFKGTWSQLLEQVFEN